VVTITGTNDAPTIDDFSLSTNEDTSYTITTAQILAQISDVDNDAITVESVTSSNGVLINNDDGTWTFTPSKNSDVDATLQITVNDGHVSVSKDVPVSVVAVADAPVLNITGEAVTQNVDVTNFSESDSGFSVTGRSINSDDTLSDASVDNVVFHGNPIGFGVKGAASGADDELGFNGTVSEELIVNLENAVASVDVAFAWKHSNEDAKYEFFMDGVSVGEGLSIGGSDGVDPAVTLQPENGVLFDTIVFTAPTSGDDYLINSISFDRIPTSDTTVLTDEDGNAILHIYAQLTDTDGSESITGYTISGVPDGVLLSAGTTDGNGTWTIVGDELSSLTLSGVDESFELTVTVHNQDTNGDSVSSTSKNISIESNSTNANDTNTVYENALAIGTNSASNAEISTGNIFGNDNLAEGAVLSSINGVAAANSIITVTTDDGNTLTVNADNTSADFGHYTYTLNNAVTHGDGDGANSVVDTFTYSITDADSTVHTADLVITIVDDVPVAVTKTLMTNNEDDYSNSGNLTDDDGTTIQLSADSNNDFAWDETSSTMPNIYANSQLVKFEFDSENDQVIGTIDGGATTVMTLDVSLNEGVGAPQFTYNQDVKFGTESGVSGLVAHTGGVNGSLELTGSNSDVTLILATATNALDPSNLEAIEVNYNNGYIGVKSSNTVNEDGGGLDVGINEILKLDIVPDATSVSIEILSNGQPTPGKIVAWDVNGEVVETVNFSINGIYTLNSSDPLIDYVVVTNTDSANKPGSFRVAVTATSYIDMVSDIDLSFAYNLTDSDGDTSPGTINVSIDEIAPTISSVGDFCADEGDNLVFAVSLSGVSGDDQIYNFSLTDIDTDSLDYGDAEFSDGVTLNAAGDTITVPAGVSSFTVTIPSTESGRTDPTEKFTLNIGSESGTGTIMAAVQLATDSDPDYEDITEANDSDAYTFTTGDDVVSFNKQNITLDAEIKTLTGNDTITGIHYVTDNAVIDTATGNDTVTISGGVEDDATINMHTDNNTLSIAYDVKDNAEIILGTGNGDITIGGGVQNFAKITMGTGNNILQITDDVTNNVIIMTNTGNDDIIIGSEDDCMEVGGAGFGGSGLKDSVSIIMKEGDDTLQVADNVQDNVSISMGTGNDEITIGGALIGSVTIDMGTGNDTITIGAGIEDSVSIDMGEGDDTLTVADGINITGDSDVAADADIFMGTGADTLDITGDVQGDFSIDTWTDEDTIKIDGDLKGNVSIYTGTLADTVNVTGNVEGSVSIDTGTYGDTIKIDGDVKDSVSINTGTYGDTIIIGGNVEGSVSIDTSASGTETDADTITIGGSLTGSASISTGTFADTITITGGLEGSASIDMGIANDTLTILGDVANTTGTVNLGTGIDTLILSSFSSEDIDTSNVVSVDAGVPTIKLKSNGQIDLDFTVTSAEHIEFSDASYTYNATEKQYELDTNSAVIIDGIIEGLSYQTTSELFGLTGADGDFDYKSGDIVTFTIGALVIGTIDMSDITDGQVFLQDIAQVSRTDVNDEYVENMAVLLQSLDNNDDAYDGIVITQAMRDAFSEENFDLASMSEQELVSLIAATGQSALSEDAAMEHVQDMLELHADMDESEFDQRELDNVLNDSLGTNEQINDLLIGGDGSDTLMSGLDDDTLTGDQPFVWLSGENGQDTISDFNQSIDTLDFSELLQDETGDNLGNYLDFSFADGNTTISIYENGDGTTVSQTIVLDGTKLDGVDDQTTQNEVTIINSLISDGALIIGAPSSDAELIQATIDEAIII
ncbi:cadherin-like domain-containing protein, partial [Psychromonas sp. MB-3u-54]|uniref:cadherin-like domain-containing protein n=1 Tax=Psychromonas sp. MB-3u-54 TaxID=2058319 RepID=UPI0012FF4352